MPRSISKPLARFWRSRSALRASAARCLLALSALIRTWSGVGSLVISVIRIKYLSVSGNHLLVRAVLLLLVSGLEVERRFPLPYAVDIDPNGQ